MTEKRGKYSCRSDNCSLPLTMRTLSWPRMYLNPLSVSSIGTAPTWAVRSFLKNVKNVASVTALFQGCCTCGGTSLWSLYAMLYAKPLRYADLKFSRLKRQLLRIQLNDCNLDKHVMSLLLLSLCSSAVLVRLRKGSQDSHEPRALVCVKCKRKHSIYVTIQL